MNFFKSVFADDPEPTKSDSDSPKSGPHSPDNEGQDPPQDQAPASSGWDFGGLIKTLTVKSESVIETYRRDLQEFSSGLKKEIEVAQGSLGTVGHAIDEFGSTVIKGTAQIIGQGKDVILAVDLGSEGSPRGSAKSFEGDQTFRRYSRFEAQVRTIQGDAGTYCEEPEDLDDYVKWKLGFDLGEKGEEMRVLLEENDVVKGIYEKVVPGDVGRDAFWCRYFYRMHKLEQAESFRATLVRRAISTEEEEELSWDVYDEDDHDDEKGEEPYRVKPKNADSERIVEESSSVNKVDSEAYRVDEVSERNLAEKEGNSIGGLQESQRSLDDKKGEDVTEVETGEKLANSRDGSVESGHVEKPSEMGKANSEPEPRAVVSSNVDVQTKKWDSKECETAPVRGQPSPSEEEDLGWDEIEDLSSIDDQKAYHGGDPTPDRAELRKRLSVTEEEEDLSWDIEDDDEPAKA